MCYIDKTWADYVDETFLVKTNIFRPREIKTLSMEMSYVCSCVYCSDQEGTQ